MTLLQKLDNRSQRNLERVGYTPPKIYVTNWSGHDFSDALKFTTLPAQEAFVAITSGDVKILHPDRLTYQIRTKLQGFTEEDYLLVCGQPIIFGLALHALLMHMKGIKLLQWNARARSYQVNYISSESFSLPLTLN